MGGGLLQLVAYGAQDVYLTGNPQITFFKVVYRRHTNFALESIQQTFNGTVGFGQRVTSTISRNGDLISRAYLELESSDKNLVPYFGLRVLKEAEVEIGGQKIDKHYSEWLYIWNELTMPVGKKEGFFNMVGGGGGQAVGHRLKLARYIDSSVNITDGDESFDINSIVKNRLSIQFTSDVTTDESVLFRVKRFGSDGTTEKTIGTTIIKATKKPSVQVAELTVLSSYGYTIDDFKNDDVFHLSYLSTFDSDKITVKVESTTKTIIEDSKEYNLGANIFMFDEGNKEYILEGLKEKPDRIRIKKNSTADTLEKDDYIYFKVYDSTNADTEEINFIIYKVTVDDLYLTAITGQSIATTLYDSISDDIFIVDYFKATGLKIEYSQWYSDLDVDKIQIKHIYSKKEKFEYYIFKETNIVEAEVVNGTPSSKGQLQITNSNSIATTISIVADTSDASNYSAFTSANNFKIDESNSGTILTANIDSNITIDTDTGYSISNGNAISKMYVPLQFWFCNNYGLALPLIGLQYHEVKIIIQFEEASKCMIKYQEPPKDLKASLWIDYIYLDTDERRKFAQSSHEYLIEQLQYTGKESVQNKLKLNFNHPVKELVWVVNKNDKSNVDWFNFTNNQMLLELKTKPYNTKTINEELVDKSTNCVKSAKLILNGNDRFYERDGRYFNLVQPFQHHTNVPKNRGVNLYSFALKPEEHQPSGTLNMSRIDTATLSLNYEQGVTNQTHSISVYAVNYNVLRILSGMGGIAYSN
jgi:hypothetical protein